MSPRAIASRIVAALLAATLTLLSPGLEPYAAAAGLKESSAPSAPAIPILPALPVAASVAGPAAAATAAAASPAPSAQADARDGADARASAAGLAAGRLAAAQVYDRAAAASDSQDVLVPEYAAPDARLPAPSARPPTGPRPAGPERAYYVTGALSRDSEFGPLSYLVHYGLKTSTVYVKTKLLLLVGGVTTAAVYLVFMPLKIAAIGRIQTGSIDQKGLRPALRKARLGLQRAAAAAASSPYLAPALGGALALAGRHPLVFDWSGRAAGAGLMALSAPYLFGVNALGAAALATPAAAMAAGLGMLAAGSHVLALSTSGGRAWLRRLYRDEDLDAVRETVGHPQVRAVIEGADVRQVIDHGSVWGAVRSLGWAIVTKVRHTRRYLLATDGPLPEGPLAGAPADLGAPRRLAASAPVTLSAHIGDHDLGMRWMTTVEELFAGTRPAIDPASADALRQRVGRKWLRDGAFRTLFYVGVSLAVGLPLHHVHLDWALGLMVFILLELNHKTGFAERFARYFGSVGLKDRRPVWLSGDPALTAQPPRARLKAMGRELWVAALSDHNLRIEATVARTDETGGVPLGAIATGLGAKRMIGSGLRQQLRALEFPLLTTSLAGAALLCALAGGLPPVAALGFLAAAGVAGMLEGLRYWLRSGGPHPSDYGAKPLPVTRAEKFRVTPRWLLRVSVPAALLAGALLSGLPALVEAAVVVAALGAALEGYRIAMGVTYTAGGRQQGILGDIFEMLFVRR